jgi:hypothetical protein
MTTSKFFSPTGSEILGTYDMIPGRPEGNFVWKAGAWVYEHESYIEMFWDGCAEQTDDDGETLYLDLDGNEWIFADLSQEVSPAAAAYRESILGAYRPEEGDLPPEEQNRLTSERRARSAMLLRALPASKARYDRPSVRKALRFHLNRLRNLVRRTTA